MASGATVATQAGMNTAAQSLADAYLITLKAFLDEPVAVSLWLRSPIYNAEAATAE